MTLPFTCLHRSPDGQITVAKCTDYRGITNETAKNLRTNPNLMDYVVDYFNPGSAISVILFYVNKQLIKSCFIVHISRVSPHFSIFSSIAKSNKNIKIFS